MPKEPNRQMDELLKASARKRREEAGAPLDLHPAARKMLQSEVARLVPKTSAASRWPSQLFWKLWPRLAVVGACAAVLVLAAVLSIQMPSHKGSKQSALSKADPNVREVAALNEQSASEQIQPNTELRKEAGVNRVSSTEGIPSANLKSDSPSVGAPRLPEHLAAADAYQLEIGKSPPTVAGGGLGGGASGRAPQVALQPGIVIHPDRSSVQLGLDRLNDAERSIQQSAANPKLELKLTQNAEVASAQENVLPLSYSAPTVTAPPTAAAASPALSALSLAATSEARNPAQSGQAAPTSSTLQTREAQIYFSRNNLSRQRYLQVPASDKVLARSATPAKAILSSFEVEQNGAALRIIDADGSVYEGNLVAAAATPERKRGINSSIRAQSKNEGAAEKNVKKEGISPSQVLQEKTVSLRKSGDQSTTWQNVAFRAVGTNRSLNKAVTVNGNFLLMPVAASNWNFGIQNQSPAVSESPPGKPSSFNLLQAPISGNVVIGGSNPVQLDAKPVSP